MVSNYWRVNKKKNELERVTYRKSHYFPDFLNLSLHTDWVQVPSICHLSLSVNLYSHLQFRDTHVYIKLPAPNNRFKMCNIWKIIINILSCYGDTLENIKGIHIHFFTGYLTQIIWNFFILHSSDMYMLTWIFSK